MHIDHCLWIAETDDNATFALFAAPEVDIADVAAARNGRLSARVRRRGDGRIFDFDVQLVAITSQRIRRGSAQCDHDPRTTIRRSEEHTSELQSLMRISYAVFCLKKKKHKSAQTTNIK